MCQETLDLEKYAEESLQKQKRIEEWKQQEKEGFKELNEEPTIHSEKQETREVVSDLPKQKADEKEIWQKRRQRIQLHKMVKKVNRLNREEKKVEPDLMLIKEGEKEVEPDSVLIKEEELTPGNVLEHFDDIKYRLDHCLYKKGDLYKRTKEAFEAAVKVLGYKCIIKKDGSVEIERIWGKEKEEAQEVYREAHKSLKKEMEKYREFCNNKAETRFQKMLESSRDVLAGNAGFLRMMNKTWEEIIILQPAMQYYPELKADEDLRELKEKWETWKLEKSEKDNQVVERLFAEYNRLVKVRTHYFVVDHALKECNKVANSYYKPYVYSIKAIYSDKMKDNEMKMKLLDKRSDSLLSLLRSTLWERPYTAEEELLLHDLGEEYKEPARRQAEEQSTYYARSYKRKEELLKQEMVKAGMKVDEKLIDKGGTRFMMFIKENEEEHNRKVVEALKLFMELGDGKAEKSKELGRLLKPILQPLFEKIENYDVEALQGLSDEQLEKRAEEFPQWAEELQELGMLNQQLGDRGKIIDPDDPLERPMKEVLCGDKVMYNYKLLMISEAALKIRSHAMLKAYKLGCLDKNSFTEREYSNNVQKRNNALVGNAELLSFIRDNLKKADRMNEANKKTRPKYEERKKVLPRLERLKQFSTMEFADCTDEVLLEHYTELKEICESIEQVNESVEKYSLGVDVYNGDKELWELKRDVMKFYYERARLLTLKNAAEAGTLLPDSFTETEKKEIREKNGIESDASISREHMKTYIQGKLEEQKGERDKIYRVYMKEGDPIVIKTLISQSAAEKWLPEKKHEDFIQEMEEVKKEALSEETEKKIREVAEKRIREEAKEASSEQDFGKFCFAYGKKLYNDAIEIKNHIGDLGNALKKIKKQEEEEQKEQEEKKQEILKEIKEQEEKKAIIFHKIDDVSFALKPEEKKLYAERVEQLNKLNKKVENEIRDLKMKDKDDPKIKELEKEKKKNQNEQDYIQFIQRADDRKWYSEYGNILKEDLAKIQKSIRDLEQENEDASQLRELKEQEQKIKRKLVYINILIGVRENKYMMADQSVGEPWITESLNRYINHQFLELPVFADMNSDEFFTMFQKLFAGCLERQKATPEEIEEYREENVQGLLLYKKYLIKHTEHLEKILHYKLPSLEYAREHWAELESLNSLSQLHGNMACDTREMFDLTNTDDQILFNKIMVLSVIGHGVTRMMQGEISALEDTKKAVNEAADDLREFLEDKDKRAENIIQEEQQLIDKFSQLAQDAKSILRRGKALSAGEQKALYNDFIARAKELETYVINKKDVPNLKSALVIKSPEVFHMEQIRAWNHQVQKKRAILGARLKKNE